MNPAPPLPLSEKQLDLIHGPLEGGLFLEGPAGCGKTTVGVERLLYLMAQGVPADAILLLVPQHTLAWPYYQALEHPGVVTGGQVTVLTLGGLAQRMIELFWPEVGAAAGFAHPDEPPVFLTLETAQYFMAYLVRPLFEQGLFDSLVIERNRIYSQVLDNLNKSALVGFPHTEIGERLQAVLIGEPGQPRVYQDAQRCASLFRQYCLEHNLLDFSLQVQVFREQLWPHPLCQAYLQKRYRHLIFDNIEEDTPAACDLLREWLPRLQSALLIYDQQAGYRNFLGADPELAYGLKELCSQNASLEENYVSSPEMQNLGARLAEELAPARPSPAQAQESRFMKPAPRRTPVSETAVAFDHHQFYPQMLEWVSEQIASLVHADGLPPSEIVVLAPYLSDALRYALVDRLEKARVPCRSLRPSRALREEPVTQCLLVLAALAHPEWGLGPARFDVAYALMQAIEGLDLVRARLLVEIVYRVKDGQPVLSTFEQIKPEIANRITYICGQRYERLRLWLEENRLGEGESLDYFLSRLFGEVLSQPGFGFHRAFHAGEISANLIESIQKFRWVAGSTLEEAGKPLGQEYLAMVADGVIAARYIRSWELPTEEAVLLAPAHTFLMSNRSVAVQFWLDPGSSGWSERLYQPLTHPYVLSRGWPRGRAWTQVDEERVTQESLYRLVLGLTRRCRQRIYLGMSKFSETGYEERSRLLTAFQHVLRTKGGVDGA